MNKNALLPLIALAALLTACAGRRPQTIPGQLAPDSPEFLLNEGVLLLNSGQLAQAEAKLKAALAKNPRLVNAHNTLGLVYVYRRDLPKAVACFDKTIELNPHYYDAYNALGMVYTELGEYDKAKANLLIAANAPDYITPENAWVNLALLEMKFAKPESAQHYVEKGLRVNKRFGPLYTLRGTLLENQQKLAEALDDFERAATLPAASADPLIGAARVLAKMGEKQKAIEKLENALSRIKDPAEKQAVLQMMQDIERQ